jgi:hypothetical protein
LDVAVSTNLARFQYDRERRLLKWAHESFEGLLRDWSDVTPFDDLVLHDPGKFFLELGDRSSVGRGLSGGYGGETDDETMAKTVNDVSIFFIYSGFL